MHGGFSHDAYAYAWVKECIANKNAEIAQLQADRDALLEAMKSPISHKEINRCFWLWKDESGNIVTRPSFLEELIAERIKQVESH